ncbi:MAG: nuclear transport factor 2 family protein [Sandaracinaceae bacterium]
MSTRLSRFTTPLALGVAALALVIGFVAAPPRAEAHRGRGAAGRGCPHGLHRRTPEQTILEHVALIQAGNIDAAMCDFAPDAVVILPGQVITGLDNIRGGLEGIGALLGGGVPEIQSLTSHGSTVLLTFTAEGTPCIIPDGSDTYIVEHGRIVAQTVHDTLYSAPGAVCPLAPTP